MTVGAIDGTSHRIYRPEVEPKEQYYSGHQHFTSTLKLLAMGQYVT